MTMRSSGRASRSPLSASEINFMARSSCGLVNFADRLPDLIGARSPHRNSHAREVRLHLLRALQSSLAGRHRQAELRGEERQRQRQDRSPSLVSVSSSFERAGAVAACQAHSPGTKMVVARASGTSSAISSVETVAIPGVERQLFDFHGDASDIGAERFHQQVEAIRLRARIRRGARAIRPRARFMAGEAAQFHHVREWRSRTCARDPVCVCRRLRNRSGSPRKPATTPGVGSFM